MDSTANDYTPAMKCRLCGAAASELLLGHTPYGTCPDCGFLGLDESLFPDPETERARYFLHDNNPEEPGYRSYLESFIETAIRPFVPAGSSILDFGSGPVPALTTILVNMGYNAESYDPYFAPGFPWENRMWDAIILHEVAEHLFDPAAAFVRLAARTAPRGIIAVRTRFRPESRTELVSWWYRMDPTHVGFFTQKTFEALAGRIGFRVTLFRKPDTVVLEKKLMPSGPFF